MGFELEDIPHFSAAPAINGLIIVADNTDVAVFAGQSVNEVELGAVGILILVN